jgi:hypothetical protein
MVKVECTEKEVARKRQMHDEDKKPQEREIKAIQHPNNLGNVKDFG